MEQLITQDNTIASLIQNVTGINIIAGGQSTQEKAENRRKKYELLLDPMGCCSYHGLKVIQSHTRKTCMYAYRLNYTVTICMVFILKICMHMVFSFKYIYAYGPCSHMIFPNLIPIPVLYPNHTDMGPNVYRYLYGVGIFSYQCGDACTHVVIFPVWLLTYKPFGWEVSMYFSIWSLLYFMSITVISHYRSIWLIS